MSNDYKSPKFKKWLDKLQQESWQLELIISGFAIYGLILAYEPLWLSFKKAENEGLAYEAIISAIGLIACAILIFNLVLHVTLRGLWIGALGLRYVSGDIDYEKLKYSEKFTKFLKNTIGSFDRYIATLEDYCSVLFAVSFLLIFYVVAIVIFFISLVATAVFLIDSESLGGLTKWIGIVLALFLIFGAILTLIDFIGQGILKKNKWVSMVYFPFYWIFSFLTLSFLYRPLVYNFLDNKFGKRLTFILIPAYTIILLIASLKYQKSNYLIQDKRSSSIYANSRNYDELLIDSEKFVNVASIPSKVIQNSYLKVFVVFSENLEDYIFGFNKGLKPKKDQRGIGTNINLVTDLSFVSKKKDSLTHEYLKTFNKTYFVVIDSMDYDDDFLISTNNKEQLGFETFIDIKDLPSGKHLIKIKRLFIRKKDTLKSTRVSIPFWYFKD